MKNFIHTKVSVILFGLFTMLALVGCNQQETTNTNGDIMSSNNKVLTGQEDLCATHQAAVIKTNYGDISVDFYCKDSPVTVNNFLNLAKKDFYNNTKFHRVIKGFMIQAGDPNSREVDFATHGQGGPGYKFKDEFNNHPLVRGSLAMANAGPNTNGSQFFIVTKDSTPWLDGKHTNFGYVTAGMEIVDKIENVEIDGRDHPIGDVIITGIEIK